MLITRIFDRIKKALSPVKEEPQGMVAGSGISAPWSGNITADAGYGSGQKFPGGMSSSRLVTIHNHFQLRQNSRNAMYDSTEARALVESMVDDVVDAGMTVKPTPEIDILGISEEQGEEWAENVARRHNLWASSKKSHRAQQFNYYQAQRLYQLFQQRDNDIFTRLYYSRDKSLVNPLQFDFLDPNQIRGCEYTSTFMQLNGDDGIIRDASGKEIGYKIWYYENGEYKEKTIPAVGEKSGRIMMLHGFSPEYAGQRRGYPRMSHLIQDLHLITNFKLSIIQKAINQASFIGHVENEEKDPTNFLEGRAVAVRQYGSNPIPGADAQNVNGASTEPIVDFTAYPEATVTVPGSTMVLNLQRGDKLKFLQDTGPSPQFDGFIGSFFSYIASSMGTSIENVLNKFNNNYSASRATLIKCYRKARIWQNEQNIDFDNPIYEMWLFGEIAAGRISAPGWSDPVLRAAWLSCEWTAPPMPNIDPDKQAKADRAYVELGAQTLDDVARNFNGSSGKANRAKNARQYEELPTPPWPPNVVAEGEEKSEEENNNGESANNFVPG